MSQWSSQWAAVEDLKPTRLPGVEFLERLVRGESWLFIHNDVTGQHARISALASQVVMALDGTLTVRSIVSTLVNDSDDDEKEAVAASLISTYLAQPARYTNSFVGSKPMARCLDEAFNATVISLDVGFGYNIFSGFSRISRTQLR